MNIKHNLLIYIIALCCNVKSLLSSNEHNVNVFAAGYFNNNYMKDTLKLPTDLCLPARKNLNGRCHELPREIMKCAKKNPAKNLLNIISVGVLDGEDIKEVWGLFYKLCGMITILPVGYIVLPKKEEFRVNAFLESIKEYREQYPKSSYFLLNYCDDYVQKIKYVNTIDDISKLLIEINNFESQIDNNFNKENELIIKANKIIENIKKEKLLVNIDEFDSDLKLKQNIIFIFLRYLNKIKGKIDKAELEGLNAIKELYEDAHNNKTDEFRDLTIFKETYEEFNPIINELLKKNYTSQILENFQNKKQPINNYFYNLLTQTPSVQAITKLLKKIDTKLKTCYNEL